jgi:predicted ribosomally synthesized peptide with nif11-like leader
LRLIKQLARCSWKESSGVFQVLTRRTEFIMSEAQLASVAEKIRQDPAWMDKFSAAETKEEWLGVAVEAARSHGVETTPAEVEAFLKDMSAQSRSSDRELSEEEVQSLAGGRYCDGCQSGI